MGLRQQQLSVVQTVYASEQAITYSASRNSVQPDSCWSWVVCLACAVSNIIICGIIISYGVMFPTLLAEFQQGKGLTGE